MVCTWCLMAAHGDRLPRLTLKAGRKAGCKAEVQRTCRGLGDILVAELFGHRWLISALPPIPTGYRTLRKVRIVPKADYDRTVVFRRKLDAVHPINCPTSQPIKPRNGMGAVSAEITKAMPKPASKILGAGPGQIIAMIGKMSMASITPMPCPASKTLETIVQARENNKTFGRDSVSVDAHIADRAEPKFGHRRQVKYKATNGQFITAKSNGRSRMNVEKLYPEGLG